MHYDDGIIETIRY